MLLLSLTRIALFSILHQVTLSLLDTTAADSSTGGAQSAEQSVHEQTVLVTAATVTAAKGAPLSFDATKLMPLLVPGHSYTATLTKRRVTLYANTSW
jgi:hypothetical protein